MKSCCRPTCCLISSIRFLAGDAEMGTLSRRLTCQEEFAQSSVVKVVTDRQGRALYFSRAPIPHARDQVGSKPPFASLHLGVYIFRRHTLNRFTSLPSGELEEAEKLEQLRALEHGIPIHVWGDRPCLASNRIPKMIWNGANASWDELMERTQ